MQINKLREDIKEKSKGNSIQNEPIKENEGEKDNFISKIPGISQSRTNSANKERKEDKQELNKVVQKPKQTPTRMQTEKEVVATSHMQPNSPKQKQFIENNNKTKVFLEELENFSLVTSEEINE